MCQGHHGRRNSGFRFRGSRRSVPGSRCRPGRRRSGLTTLPPAVPDPPVRLRKPEALGLRRASGKRGLGGPRYHSDQVQVMLPGAALAPFAMKPKVADLPAASVLLYDMLVAVTFVPDWVKVASHIWLICWPPGNVQPTFQPFRPEDPAVTVNWPWNPPDQLLTSEYVAVQAPPPPVPMVQVNAADPDAPVPSFAVAVTL